MTVGRVADVRNRFPRDPSRGYMGVIMESEMEKNMENEMGIGLYMGIQVRKEYLHWALKSVNITYIGLIGSLGVSSKVVHGLRWRSEIRLPASQILQLLCRHLGN